MKVLYVAFYVISLVAISVAPSWAKNEGKLPEGAVPLPAEETVALYAGNTIDWKPAKVYWNRDGTALGYTRDGDKEYLAEGSWSAKGNELCFTLSWRGKTSKSPFVETACDQFFKVGKKIWTKNIQNSDDKYVGDIYLGIQKKMLKGDQITKKAAALKAKFSN